MKGHFLLVKGKIKMGVYRRLLTYLKPYRWRFVFSIFCMLLAALANALFSITAYLTTNGLVNREKVIVDNIPHVPFIPQVSFSTAWIPVIIVVVMCLRSLSNYGSEYQMASIGIRIVRKLREQLYRHLIHSSSEFYSKGRTGDFLSRILNDVRQVQSGATDVVVDMIQQPLTILFTVPFVFIWGGYYAIYAVIIFPVVAVPIIILGKMVRRLTRRMNEETSDITAYIGESLSGIHIVKAFSREEITIQKFESINRRVFDFFKRTIHVTILQRPLIEIMGSIGVALAVWFGIKTLPPDRFIAFIGTLFTLYEPLKKISKVNSTIQQSVASAERVFEILDTTSSIADDPNAIDFKSPVDQIDFKHIRFGYETGELVLNDIDLSVKKDEVVALVGSSGAGKTTLMHLLIRFYDPTEGSILINGKDIRGFTLNSLRGIMGYVTQETVLFHGTVRDNIVFGEPEASQEQVKAAAKIAYADHFIEALPNGYDTPIGERGLKLSGGQRQRIAIARAILKNPPILILDEATSHLDTESEREVQGALESAMKGRTVFVIAHRLSTIQRADRILVMDKGCVVQQGTNEALLKEGGIYKKLYNLQFDL